MQRVFADYHDAHAKAVRLARELGREVGIEAAKEYGKPVYRVLNLPRPENRTGFELRCEIVGPSDPLSAADIATVKGVRL